jgi:hypothetical protein
VKPKENSSHNLGLLMRVVETEERVSFTLTANAGRGIPYSHAVLTHCTALRQRNSAQLPVLPDTHQQSELPGLLHFAKRGMRSLTQAESAS